MFTLKDSNGTVHIVASRLTDAQAFVNPIDSKDTQLYIEEIKCIPSQQPLPNTPKSTKNAQEL